MAELEAQLTERVATLEAAEEIRALVARHALAYDARDLTTLAELYAPDVREHALAGLVAALPPGRSFHLTADPEVSFTAPERARAQVVCRREQESGEEWIVAGVVFSDEYVRHEGRWYVQSRSERVAYAADVLARP